MEPIGGRSPHALTGDPQPALETLIEDPASPTDKSACRAIFDELCQLQGVD